MLHPFIRLSAIGAFALASGAAAAETDARSHFATMSPACSQSVALNRHFDDDTCDKKKLIEGRDAYEAPPTPPERPQDGTGR